jgi:hypothetical protein
MTKINAEGTASGESKRGTVAGTVEFCERGSLFLLTENQIIKGSNKRKNIKFE